MATVTKLVTKPSLPAEIKANIIRLLQVAMADAEAGNVSTMLVIAVRPDGTWSREWSGTEEMGAMIGRLEITKQEWIADYSEGCSCPIK